MNIASKKKYVWDHECPLIAKTDEMKPRGDSVINFLMHCLHLKLACHFLNHKCQSISADLECITIDRILVSDFYPYLDRSDSDA